MMAEAAEKTTASNTDTATTSQAAASTDQPEVRFPIPTPLDPEYSLGFQHYASSDAPLRQHTWSQRNDNRCHC